MICLSAATADISGHVCFKHKRTSTIKSLAGRISRVKTLDGGSVIAHNGVTDGDRDLIVSADINQKQEEILWHLFKNHPRVILSIDKELLLCTIQKLKTDNGNLTMNIFVINSEV